MSSELDRDIGIETYALLTSTSTCLNSSGNPPTNPSISSAFDTSNLTGNTLTPGANFPISSATSFSVSMRRAVRTSFRSSGLVRANSKAQERPIPDDAPVIRIVLPARRAAIEEDILADVVTNCKGEDWRREGRWEWGCVGVRRKLLLMAML